MIENYCQGKKEVVAQESVKCHCVHHKNCKEDFCECYTCHYLLRLLVVIYYSLLFLFTKC
jgi:hypothetical protein